MGLAPVATRVDGADGVPSRRERNLSPAERAELGRAARGRLKRSALAEFDFGSDRADPVDTLAAQDEARLGELVPVRYGRMLDTPFTFYRGAAAIMAADLGAQQHSGLDVQLCGDAHLSNFGVFEAPDRRLVFDVNDFDETLPGPFEWDVKRLAVSLEVAGRSRGFSRKQRRRIVLTGASSYREAMHRFAGMRDIDVWYSRVDVEEAFSRLGFAEIPGEIKRFEKAARKARAKDSLRALSKLCERVDGELRIAHRPPVLVPAEVVAEGFDVTEVDAWLGRLLDQYHLTLGDDCRELVERYRYVDAGRKVVGVGSVGTRAWIILLLGRDDDDPLFLQAKEAGPSVLEPFTGRSVYQHHGQRVVAGQRLMQAAGDVLLGWLTATEPSGETHDFYVRQLWDGKASAEIDAMDPLRMETYAGLCGGTLARAHARSGDAIAIASYLGTSDTFDRALAEFSRAYADQNETDYATLSAAVEDGRVAAKTGV